MGLFSNPECIVLKEGSSARKQLEALESLRGTLPPKAEQRLETDIRNVKAGIAGEDRIMYELKNSHLDMVVLQDLFLEHNGLTAQIDFLVITQQRSFVLECKNLYGNIEVNSRGDFVRVLSRGRKEGMYSPITQNQRHLDLIEAMKRDSRGLAMNLLVGGDFVDAYRPLVVLANPKTVLDDRYAKREVKKQLIRVDQLVATIKAVNDEKGPAREKCFKSAMRDNAEWFLERHKENAVDYAARYREIAQEAGAGELSSTDVGSQVSLRGKDSGRAAGGNSADVAGSMSAEHASADQSILCPRCGAPMVLRTAKRGARAGKQFYGCSKYPACRGIVNIGE